MNKAWNAFTWVLIVTVQIVVGYGLVILINSLTQKPPVVTVQQFLLIPFSIWLGYLTGIYGIGMLGLVLKKIEPRVAGLRLLTTAVLTAVPVLMLIFNGTTVGLENQQQFQAIVMGRMVPYYTQLCAVFSLLGFYVTIWWHRAAPQKAKPDQR